MDRSAYRFGGITLAIVLLVRRVEPAWHFAFHRFAEVSTGIAVALVMTVVSPERDATTSKQPGKNIPDEPTAAFGERSRPSTEIHPLNESDEFPSVLVDQLIQDQLLGED